MKIFLGNRDGISLPDPYQRWQEDLADFKAALEQVL
jgi:hypothetical protein